MALSRGLPPDTRGDADNPAVACGTESRSDSWRRSWTSSFIVVYVIIVAAACNGNQDGVWWRKPPLLDVGGPNVDCIMGTVSVIVAAAAEAARLIDGVSVGEERL
jgi:hypothetical protein